MSNKVRNLISLSIVCVIQLLILPAYSKMLPEKDEPKSENVSSVFPNPMCGPNCLWMVARLFGKDISLLRITQLCGVYDKTQASLKDMVFAANKIGLEAIAVKLNYKTLCKETRIAIVHILVDRDSQMNGHYVLLDSATEDKVTYADDGRIVSRNVGQFLKVWDGYAVLIGPNSERNHRLEHLRRYFGTVLKISGLLMLLVVTIYGGTYTYQYLSK